jgi:hypothetical protein
MFNINDIGQRQFNTGTRHICAFSVAGHLFVYSMRELDDNSYINFKRETTCDLLRLGKETIDKISARKRADERGC